MNILLLIAAIALSLMSGYFSITGMAQLFPASPIAIMLMMAALECSKIICSVWLHNNWSSKTLSKLFRGYMVAAIAVLMMLTSLGIYGFLAHGHLQQQAPLAGIELQIAQKNQSITQLTSEMQADDVRLNQLDSAINNMIQNDKSQQALKLRRSQASERREIKADKESLSKQIEAVNAELLPLKTQVNDVETKLGPVKYVADLLGIKDTEGAVRIIILMIMFAFDPLAILMATMAAAGFKKETNDHNVTNPADNSTVDKKEEMKYTLDELLAEMPEEQELTEEQSAWEQMIPVGSEFGSAEHTKPEIKTIKVAKVPSK